MPRRLMPPNAIVRWTLGGEQMPLIGIVQRFCRPSRAGYPWVASPRADNDFESRYTMRASFLIITRTRYVIPHLPGLLSMTYAIARNSRFLGTPKMQVDRR